MTTPASHSSLPTGTPAPAAALGLARLMVKAHGSGAPAEIAHELLASLLTGSGATRGALVLTQSDVDTRHGAPRVLAVSGVDAGLVRSILAEPDQRSGNRPALSGHDWVRITVPLGEHTPQPDSGQHRRTETTYVLLMWEGERADERQVRGQSYINVLHEPIAAVVVSVLATERRLELERLADERIGDHLNAELLGTVSHELRSPLAAIKGYASTLLCAATLVAIVT